MRICPYFGISNGRLYCSWCGERDICPVYTGCTPNDWHKLHSGFLLSKASTLSTKIMAFESPENDTHESIQDVTHRNTLTLRAIEELRIRDLQSSQSAAVSDPAQQCVSSSVFATFDCTTPVAAHLLNTRLEADAVCQSISCSESNAGLRLNSRPEVASAQLSSSRTKTRAGSQSRRHTEHDAAQQLDSCTKPEANQQLNCCAETSSAHQHSYCAVSNDVQQSSSRSEPTAVNQRSSCNKPTVNYPLNELMESDAACLLNYCAESEAVLQTSERTESNKLDHTLKPSVPNIPTLRKTNDQACSEAGAAQQPSRCAETAVVNQSNSGTKKKKKAKATSSTDSDVGHKINSGTELDTDHQCDSCSEPGAMQQPNCWRSTRTNKFAGSLSEKIDKTRQFHEDMLLTEAVESVSPEEATRMIKRIDKAPHDGVRSKYVYAYYLDKDRTSCNWQEQLWSRKCFVAGCQAMTTLNYGWCPTHLHRDRKITTGISPLGGLGQFATSSGGCKSRVFKRDDRILMFNEFCQLISHANRKKRYGNNTPTYAAAYLARASDGSGIRFDKHWKQPKGGPTFRKMYCDGALTRNPASLCNQAGVGFNARCEMFGEELWLVATRDIMDGEEILWNYGPDYNMEQEANGITLEYDVLCKEATEYRQSWLATHNEVEEAKNKSARVQAVLANSINVGSTEPLSSANSAAGGSQEHKDASVKPTLTKSAVKCRKKLATLPGQRSIKAFLSGSIETKALTQAAGAENVINSSSSSSSRACIAVCDVNSVHSIHAKTGETPLGSGSASSLVQLPVTGVCNLSNVPEDPPGGLGLG